MMAYKTILLDDRDGITALTFNRPERLNAMSPELVDEVQAALQMLAGRGDVRVLLVTGAGKGFSSGADLAVDSLKSADTDLGADLERRFNPLLEALFALPFPVVAAVNGPAAGGGCALALAADIVVASHSAYFVQTYMNIGLVPDVGSTWMLPRQIGRARATAMMMLGERVSAQLAEQWGMIWKAVPDENLLAEARGIAARFAAGPTRAYAMTRIAIRKAMEGSLPESLAEERRNQYLAGRTEDFIEGVTAFLEKRKPIFRGR